MSKHTIRMHRDSSLHDVKQDFFKIDGSALTTTSSSAGLLSNTRLANVKDATNVVTLTFKEGLKSVPLGARFDPTDTSVQTVARNVTISKTAITYTTVDASDNSAVSDVDGLLTVTYSDSPDNT
jgi:hypothetical protein